MFDRSTDLRDLLVVAGGFVTVKLWGTVRRMVRRNRVRLRTPPADGAA